MAKRRPKKADLSQHAAGINNILEVAVDVGRRLELLKFPYCFIAEDLVVLKTFASRPQDWIDVEKVIVRQGSRLNRQLILEELTPLAELKDEPEIMYRLQQLFQQSHT